MTWTDFHIIGDLLAAKLLWTAIAELALKPIIYWKYEWLKANFGGILHGLKL